MKNIKEIFGDTSEKNMSRISKAADNCNCGELLTSFLAEATSATAMDFPKVKCLVTSGYLCCYQNLGSVFDNRLMIFPLESIVSVYRANINDDNKYDYENFYLAVELKNGRTYHVAHTKRNAKTFTTTYTDVINCVMSRLTVTEV